MLLVSQAASPVSWRRLGVEFRCHLLFQLSPFLSVRSLLDRTMLGLKLFTSRSDNRELVVFESTELVPGNVTMIMPGGMKDLPDTGRPVAILLEELRHRQRARAFFANVRRVVQYAILFLNI